MLAGRLPQKTSELVKVRSDPYLVKSMLKLQLEAEECHTYPTIYSEKVKRHHHNRTAPVTAEEVSATGASLQVLKKV